MPRVHAYLCDVDFGVDAPPFHRVDITATVAGHAIGGPFSTTTIHRSLSLVTTFSATIDVPDTSQIAVEIVITTDVGDAQTAQWTVALGHDEATAVAVDLRREISLPARTEPAPSARGRGHHAAPAPPPVVATVTGVVILLDEPLSGRAAVARSGASSTSTGIVLRADAVMAPPVAGAPRQRVWAHHNETHAAWVDGDGWTVVFSTAFSDTTALWHQLNAPADDSLIGAVEALGIVAHGPGGSASGFGTVYMGEDVNVQSLRTNHRLRMTLRTIGRSFLTPSAQVGFYSCSAAAGRAGSDFLRALSLLWLGRTVIGFVTAGFTSPYATTAAGNVTDTLTSAGGLTNTSLRLLPTAASAKHALNGRIVQWPQPVQLYNDYMGLLRGQERHIYTDARNAHTTPFRYYISSMAMIDPDNPHIPAEDPPDPPEPHGG